MSESIGRGSETPPDLPRASNLNRLLRDVGARIWDDGRGGEWRYIRKDRLPITTVLLVMAILAMTIADGLLTILLLDHQFEEANPLMRFFLGIHPVAFVVAKYALTALWLPFLLIFGHRQIFLPRLRVSHLLPIFVLMYSLLLAYQILLIMTL